MLDSLDRANLFLVPLDHHREWFRYHHLFAQLLRARLQSQYDEQVQHALHRSAAHWFAEKNLILEAVEHAAAAKDYDWLADLLESRLKRPATWSHGEVNQYLAWLNRLPASILEARPSLCTDIARCLHIAGNTQEGREWLEKAECSLSAWPPSEEKQHLRGIITANWATFLVMSGEDHRAVKAAEEALAYLPEKDALWHMRAMHALALSNDELGDSDLSLQIYEQAIHLARQTSNTFLDLSTTGNLAYVLVRRGALRQAAQVCQQTLEAAESQGKATPAVSLPKIAMGGILFERNQLAEAENTLQEGLDLAERGGIGLVVKNSGVLATIAWVRLARGNRSGAQQTLDQVDELFAYSNHQWLRQRLNQEAARAHLALALGDVRHAMDWARAYEQTGPTEFTREVPDIVLARVYLADEQPGRAQLLLERLLADALQRGQNRAAIEIAILLAVTFTRLKKPEAARSALFKAVELAAPEGFVRLFVAEGEPMRDLMEEARRQAKSRLETGFIEQVLADLPKSDPMSPVERANHALVEPLTEREQEVLRYLSVGLTLPEIAQKLYLSPNTLKAHTNNIYSKLDAHSRLQAVTKARDLGLLG
jgi:LuxR family maltose regulon positive regulatory protein